MTDKVPDFSESAFSLLSDIQMQDAGSVANWNAKASLDRIEAALLSAYRRGAEEAAKVAAKDDSLAPGGFGNMDYGPNVVSRIAAAIRRLGEAEQGGK